MNKQILLEWLQMNKEEEKEIREELRLLLCNTLAIRESLGAFKYEEYAEHNLKEITRLQGLLNREFAPLPPTEYQELYESKRFRDRLNDGTRRRARNEQSSLM